MLRELWLRATTVQPPLAASSVLLVGVAVLLITWSPIGYRLVRHLITLVHEAGHALVATLAGRSLRGIRLHSTPGADHQQGPSDRSWGGVHPDGVTPRRPCWGWRALY